jgi:hypothetical protein
MPALEYADNETISRVAMVLRVNRTGLEMSRNVLNAALQKPAFEDKEKEELKKDLILTLTGLGEFESAISILGKSFLELMESTYVWEIFNGAIIYWGIEQAPRIDLFRHALFIGETAKFREDPNFYQCMALSAFAVGDIVLAEKKLARAFEVINGPGRAFSCWTYTEVTRSELAVHLREMQAQGRAGELQPPVTRRTESVV